MGKDIFGKMMPRALSQNPKIMDEQIMLACKCRHLSMQDITERATVTWLIVSKVEHGGEPRISMGIFTQVFFSLNLENYFTLHAADDALDK